MDPYPERVPEEEQMLDSEVESLAISNFFVGMEHPFISYLKKFYPRLHGDKALEIGCGSAQLSALVALHYRHFSVCAVDLSQQVLDRAAEFINFLRLEGQVSLLCARLPSSQPPSQLQERSFDLVFSRSTLHHFRNPLDFWRSVKTYMKVNGSVLVQDLTRPRSLETLDRLVQSAYAGLAGARRRSYLAAYRANEIREQLEESGLDLVVHEPKNASQVFIYRAPTAGDLWAKHTQVSPGTQDG